MSWNKNTVIVSEIDAAIKVLEAYKKPYSLTVIGTVIGRGLNDLANTKYPIRRLSFEDRVILEAMFEAGDCDSDDWLISEEFSLENEPKNWSCVQREEEYQWD